MICKESFPYGASDRQEADRTRTSPGKDTVRSFLNWILTIPFLLVFGATLVIFDPLQRLARLFGPRPHEIAVGIMQVCLVASFRFVGTRIEVDRSAKVLPRTPYLLISNHQSLFDIPLVGATLFSNFPKYVSKTELARGIPSISYNLRRGGNAIIDRSDVEQALPVIRELGETAARRRVSALIYPEGTRARTGRLRAFRLRGALALLEGAPELPVIPVTIDGSWQLLQHNLLPVPLRTRVRIRFADPIERKNADNHEILAVVHREIRRTLAGWRGDSPEEPKTTA